MQEFSPDGRLPTIYDYDRQQTMAISRLTGKMTRYGEVTELLHDRDDRFVIFGPGDEVTVTLTPVRNGKPLGRLLAVVLPNGKKLGVSAATSGEGRADESQ